MKFFAKIVFKICVPEHSKPLKYIAVYGGYWISKYDLLFVSKLFKFFIQRRRIFRYDLNSWKVKYNNLWNEWQYIYNFLITFEKSHSQVKAL